MIEYIEAELVANLQNAKSILIAVALMKEYGFKTIEDNLPDTCKRKYLIGIHLPTPPNILRKLLQLQQTKPNDVATKVYDANENYHPKAYLIEKNSGDLIAFIGSANATRGGFSHNIEMSVAITDQSNCIKIKEWFNSLFQTAKHYDETFIEMYEVAYKRNKSLAATQKSNIDVVTNNYYPVPGNNLRIVPGQYFRQGDFDAFAASTHYDTSPKAVQARAKVRERLIELNNRIIKYFPDYNITNLFLPARRNFYTSQHFHSRGNTHIAKESIWLHYGKSVQELSLFSGYYYQRFVNHIRMQVILENRITADIGIWLYISKHGSSYFDRQKLKAGLNDMGFVERLYEYIIALGGAYWIMLGEQELFISDINSSEELKIFLLQDNYQPELIIGRNYQPNDPNLSEENIAETVLIEFLKLYKIYDLIKA